MKTFLRLSLASLMLVCAAGLLTGCGANDKDNDNATARTKEPYPFLRLKLKNTSPPGGHPASAMATSTANGAAGPTLGTGQVQPSMTGTSAAGTEAADSVTVTVTFVGGLIFRGTGTYPLGAKIGTVDVECGEPGPGTATVTFADGRPTKTLPLTQ